MAKYKVVAFHSKRYEMIVDDVESEREAMDDADTFNLISDKWQENCEGDYFEVSYAEKIEEEERRGAR